MLVVFFYIVLLYHRKFDIVLSTLSYIRCKHFNLTLTYVHVICPTIKPSHSQFLPKTLHVYLDKAYKTYPINVFVLLFFSL